LKVRKLNTLDFISDNMKMKFLSILAVIFFFGLSNCSLLRSRKRRQIMDAINALTEEALEAERMEEVMKEGKVQMKEEVPSVKEANMLRCEATVNSQCGGNECVVSCSDGKGEKVALSCESGFVDVKASSGDAAIVEVRCGTAAAEVDQGKALEMEEVVSRKRRQDSNPFFGRGQRNQKSEGFENVQRASNPGLFGNVQQCQGGRCDQLNLLSRRKRQIMEAMETLTEEVDKFEKEVEQLEKDLLMKDEQQVHMLSCDSNVNSQCKGKECVVSCGDGKGSKITLQCEDGLVDVNSVNSRDVEVQVRCGSAKEAAGTAKAFRDLLQSQSPIFQM